MSKRVLAFDFGASSGRAIIGSYENGKITLDEVHRFLNEPVSVGGTVYWDVLRLFHEIKQGILKAKQAGGFDSIGIDTWGVDFGLIDKDGKLIENPVHYRDERNRGMIEEAEKYMSKDEMYSRTGIQFMDFNTVFQLLSIKKNRPHVFDNADKLLFMPDLFNFMLTGCKSAEYSIATTSQMINIDTKTWDKEIINRLSLPEKLLCDIVPAGSRVGMLSDEICKELSVESVPVVAVCGHDTQSAITAVPNENKDFVFISSGTWSLFGTEIDSPIVDEKSKEMNVTNEGGYGYSTAFLKNICGLWLIQESRRQWMRESSDYSYAELESLALECESFKCFIDPDAPEFGVMGDIPSRVKAYCKKTNQYVPESVGEVVRCIYESLALKYRMTYDGIKNCTGKTYDSINVVGGGTKDGLLSSMTACACGVKVYAGPVEATVLGNVAVQLISSGDIKDIAEARKIISDSFTLKEYEPKDSQKWNEACERFKNIINS